MNKRIIFTVVMLLLTASTGLASLTDGLAAYYPFDGNANDLSGNANHAVVYGALPTEGRADHAYLFDGFDDTIEAPHSASLDITGPITVSCWVKAHDTYWRSGLVIKAPDYDPSVGYHLRTVYDKAHFGLYYSVGSTHKGGGVSSDTLVNDNVWHLVTGTYDGSEIRMYVDGQLETLTPYSLGYESNTAALQIGHYYYPYSDLWGPGHEGRHNVTLNGAIDEVRIYNRALDQSEITELYTGEPEPPVTTLSGIVYEDLNLDGQYSADALPFRREEISGAVVSTDQGATSITDVDGRYSFGDLAPGALQLSVEINSVLFRVINIDIVEGDNTSHNIEVSFRDISEAYECADADTVCALSTAGLMPYIGVAAQLALIGNDLCNVKEYISNREYDKAFSAGVKAVIGALFALESTVDPTSAGGVEAAWGAINCAEAQLEEKYEEGIITPDEWQKFGSQMDELTVAYTISPVDVRILNSSGNVMELNSEGLTENQLGCPGWIFKLNGHRDLAVILDAGGDYVVQIVGRPEAGTGSTFGLQLMRQTSDGSQTISSYTNVPISAQGTATTVISDGITPILEVDVDGDGTFEESITPDEFNIPPVADAGPDQTVEQEGYEGTEVTLDASGSIDPDSTPGTNDDIILFEWYEGTTPLGIGETLDYTFPLGEHTVTLVVTDSCGETDDDEVIIVVEDTIPPTVNSVLATPSVLWPPNHKMVEVILEVDAEDICDPDPLCMIVDVTSNEPINGPGDGNTEPDWEYTDDYLVVLLRAERAGTGTGRIYTIHVVCIDLSGNISQEMEVDIRVPHDQGKGKGFK